ncbi:hypothetical protein DPM33_15225 [Mesorhizobium hawassense]|uniref:Ribbon-helix-helix protein CopG domain-containing protein n=1 Tax=Mesorhizobium hawassense TaxID=1209954 RepID=A0A330HR05_9HYPH|nr:hypothetical protein DPM33_15225 [Mesorhizobium hawassense]
MDVPPKRTYRLQFMLNAKELAALDAWRFEKRMSTRSEAARELFRHGITVTGDDADRAGGERSADFMVLPTRNAPKPKGR